MNIKIDMSLCRVCRKQGPGTNIYTGNILEKFLYTTLVQVEKNDGLPEIICKKCMARLHIAYDFKKDASATNTELRSFLSKVNKDYQQLTAGGGGGGGSGGAKSKNKSRNESIQMDGLESYDELDENIEALIEEHEEKVFKIDADDALTDEKSAVDDDNQELVEILTTSNSVVELQETQTRRRHVVAIAENGNDEPSDTMAVYFIEDDNEENNSEMDSNDSDYVPNEYSDENAGEIIINDNIDEAQYLEFDENTDQLYDAQTSPKKQGTPRKQTRNPSNHNAENRCDVCDKVFSTRTNLTRHKITHEGRKPYVCEICNSSFTQNGSLKSHMFIHTGERPFKCNICTKAFTQSKSLVFHKRRHTGEKPFPCDHCGVQFRQKDGLKRHIAAKHTQNPSKYHVCEVCGKTLLSKYSLNMHVSKHTAKEVATAKKNRLKSERAAAKKSTPVIIAPKTEDEKDMEMGDVGYEIYGCEYCDQEFTNTTDLLEHRDTHAEVQDTKYIDDSS